MTPSPNSTSIYPAVYTQNVVGNLWDMLADFQVSPIYRSLYDFNNIYHRPGLEARGIMCMVFN